MLGFSLKLMLSKINSQKLLILLFKMYKKHKDLVNKIDIQYLGSHRNLKSTANLCDLTYFHILSSCVLTGDSVVISASTTILLISRRGRLMLLIYFSSNSFKLSRNSIFLSFVFFFLIFLSLTQTRQKSKILLQGC